MKHAPTQMSSTIKMDTWKPKRGVKRVKRYSFEITHELDEMLDERIMSEQSLHKRRISKSAVIRQAIQEYLLKG